MAREERRVSSPTAPIRAVLFDVAGTLLRPAEPVGETYARLAAEFGILTSAAKVETAFRHCLRQMPPMVFPGDAGRRVERERDWWRTLVATVLPMAGAGGDLGNLDRCFDRLFAHFADAAAWQLLPGAREALVALREMGLHTGVISNFDHRLGAILAGLGLLPLLDVVMLPAEAGAAKPDRRIFHAALQRLRVAPRASVYVGDDMAHDIEGARAAGLEAIDVATVTPLTRVVTVLGPRAADRR